MCAVIYSLLFIFSWQQEELTAKEANIILYTEHQIRNLGTYKTEYPEQPNVRYVRMAHLYVKIYVLISHCFDICGVHEMTVWFFIQEDNRNYSPLFFIPN